MASACMSFCRGISTTCVSNGKRNFRKFLLYNKRGSRIFKEQQRTNPNSDISIDRRGTRSTGYTNDTKWISVPEMIPEIIVPSLENFYLKPYVSYKVENVENPEFTAKDLFNLVYANKIKDDFKNHRLGPNGEPLNPSQYEKLTPQEAKELAEKTGTDIFTMEGEKS